MPVRPPSILLVTQIFPPQIGGSGILLANLYSRLPEHRVLVLTRDGIPQADDADLGWGSMEVTRRPIQSDSWGLSSPAALKQRLRSIRAIRSLAHPQSTLVHCARAVPEGLAALLARSLGGPRFIVWAHGEEIEIYRSSRELTALSRLVYRRAAAIAANSAHTASLLTAFGVDEQRITVIRPGVDVERFNPAVDGATVRQRLLGGPGPLVLSVGRLQRRKGHDLAIRAVALLKDRIPSLRYVIAGTGPEEERLRELTRELGVEDVVAFAGGVSDVDLPEYYAASDIFLLPNRVDGADFEGFGIVFLEAAAIGKPGIGGRSGGVPEAVDEGTTGLLVSGTDAGELAGALERLATDPALRQTMGRAAALRAREGFTWERGARQVARLQDAIAGDSGR
jgi:phosphatidylinositol alpha-1,6-mannosyltransferase